MIRKAAAAAALILLPQAAPAQNYDPASGQGPLVLLEVPGDGIAYYHAKVRARTLFRSEAWAELEPVAEQLVRDYPRDPENWFMLARTRGRLGRWAQAAPAWEKAGPLNGYRIAYTHLQRGDRRAALDVLRQTIFERRGFFRTELYDWPEFRALHGEPEFMEMIGRPDTSGWTREQGWRYDLDLLLNETWRVNPDFRGLPLPAEVTRRYEQLKRDIPRLSDEQIFVGMARMLAPLHQGHVALWNPPGNRYLPLRFYAFPDGLYVIEAADPALYGARVLSFGDTPADEALRRLAETASVDGDMQHLWGVNNLAETAYLRGLGLSPTVDSIRMTLRERGGRTRPVAVATAATAPEGRQDRMVPPAGVPAPLFLRDIAEPQKHWETPLPGHDALYVQVNNLVDEENETLERFGLRLWEVIDSVRPRNLILDLRHNNGGSTSLYPQLLRTLVAFSRPAGNQVYVLIGRRSYSATGNFVTDLERLVDPIFVGEASSECCNLYGDPTGVRLPYSGVQGELTALKWMLSEPWDHRREISPEVPVQLTAADYFAGRDPVLEAVFRMIAAPPPPSPPAVN